MKELKPCPFCGENNPEVIEYSLGSFVLCPNCGVATTNRPTAEEVVEVWNQRASQ